MNCDTELPVVSAETPTVVSGSGSQRFRQSILSNSKSQHDSVMCVQSCLEQHHGTQVCRFNDCVKIIVLLVLIGSSAALINTQKKNLVRFAEMITSLEELGHVIFHLLFIWVGLPWGYNWSTIIVLVGFAYGWRGLIDTNIGTLVGAVITYYLAHTQLRTWSQQQASKMPAKLQLYLMATLAVIETGKGGFVMLIVMRMNPVSTFGMSNAFFGAFCDIPLPKYIATTFIATQYNILKMTSIGILVRQMGSFSAASKSEEGRRNLLASIVITICLIVAGYVFVRYLTVKALPNMISTDDAIAVPGEIIVAAEISQHPVWLPPPSLVGRRASEDKSCYHSHDKSQDARRHSI